MDAPETFAPEMNPFSFLRILNDDDEVQEIECSEILRSEILRSEILRSGLRISPSCLQRVILHKSFAYNVPDYYLS